MSSLLDEEMLEHLETSREEIYRFVGNYPWSAAFRPTPDDGWYVLSDSPEDPHSVAMATSPEVALYIADLGNLAPELVRLARVGLLSQQALADIARVHQSFQVSEDSPSSLAYLEFAGEVGTIVRETILSIESLDGVK